MEQQAKLAGSEARLINAVMAYCVCDDATKSGGEFVPGFDRWLREARWEHWGEVQEAPVLLSPQEAEWLSWTYRVQEFAQNQFWNHTDWGPRPGKPRCRVPLTILQEHGLAGNG